MKIERLLAIVMLLLGRRRLSASELAKHFEVSLRTIYRDLETINTAGIPIVSYPGASGGYEIMESFTIDRQYLSLDELVTLVAALKGVHTSAADRQVGPLLEKIKALVGSTKTGIGRAHPIVYDFNPWGSTEESTRKINALRQAIEKRQRVAIHYTKYQGDAQDRTVEPVTLILKGYVWYVYGYCLLRRSYRLFRLSRMGDVVVTSESFPPHPQTVEALEWREEWDQTDQVSLILEFAPSVQVRVKDMFSPEETVALENGSLRVQTMASNDEWLHGMLLSFGDALTVIEPESVRNRIRDTARKMLERYEK